jgi:putative peptidoglycan lipid II flippase
MNWRERNAPPGNEHPGTDAPSPYPGSVLSHTGPLPTARGLLRTSVAVGALLLATKGLGFIRDPLVAALYGATAVSDAFYTALGIVNLLYSVVLGGLVASVIPLFVSRRSDSDDRTAWRFLSALMCWLVVGFVIIGVAMYWFAGGIVRAFAPGMTVESHELAVRMLKILLPLPLLTAVTTTLTSALNCYNRFLVPAAVPFLGSAVAIVLLVLLTPRLGIPGAAVAVVVGLAVQALTVGFVAFGVATQFSPGLRVVDPALVKAVRLAGPGIVAEGLLNGMTVTILYLATSLGPGVYSSIQYGNKVVVVFLDVCIAAISVVMYPQLARAAAAGGVADLKVLTSLNLRMMALALVPITVAILILKVPLVQLVYQRRAFDVQATRQTAIALGLLALSLVPHAVKDVCMRGFYALHDSSTPLAAIAIAVALDIALSLLLFRSFGGSGLVLAYSISVGVLAAILVWQLYRRGAFVYDRRFRTSITKIALATGAMALALLGARALLDRGGHATPGVALVEMAFYASLCGLVYLVSLVLLREEEIGLYLPPLLTRWRKRT